MDKSEHQEAPEPEGPQYFVAAIAALRDGHLADAQNRFLATLGKGPRPRETIWKAAQAYRDAGRIEDGRIFLRRALEIEESVEERHWLFNGFLLLAGLAQAWQLHADEERLLRRELEFREKAGHGGLGEVLGQLAVALKAQGKKQEARRAIRRRMVVGLWTMWGIRYPIAGVLAVPVGLGLVVWRCGMLAALAVVVLGYLWVRLLFHVLPAAKLDLPIEYGTLQKRIAEVAFFVAVAVMALGLLGWISRGVAVDLGWQSALANGIRIYPERFYFTGWAVAISVLLFLRHHIQVGKRRRP